MAEEQPELTPNDPKRNLQEFRNALQSQQAMASSNFGSHSGAVVATDTPRPVSKAEPTEDDPTNWSEVDQLIDRSAEPILAAPMQEVPEFNPAPIDVVAARETPRPVAPLQPVRPPAPRQSSLSPQPTAPSEYPAPEIHEPVPYVLPNQEVAESPAPVPKVTSSPAAVTPGAGYPATPKPTKELYGLPEFMQRMATPERPIMDGPNPNEPSAEFWNQQTGRNQSANLDPAGKPVERQAHANERQQQERFIEMNEAVDDFGNSVDGFAMGVVATLRQITQRLNRMEQSLASEGSDYA